MRHPWLKFRMVIAGSVLFVFYAILGLLFLSIIGHWAGLLGIPLFIIFQYVATIKMGLWSLKGDILTPEDDCHLYDNIQELSDEMGLPMPTVYIADMGTANAMALGRKNNGAIVLSRSLVRILEEEELLGVIAHELSHLKNRDSVLTMLGTSIAALFGSGILLIFFIASFDSEHPQLVQIIGVITSTLVYAFVQIFVRAISRYREYVADDDAVRATDNPKAFINGLKKVQRKNEDPNAGEVHPNLSALCFSGGTRGILAFLFSTHPPMEKRIRRIQTIHLE